MTFKFFWPLETSLRTYRRETLRADLLAGVTTAVFLVPQGMAYAMLAGLPPIMGIYAALIPPFVYALLGTSRQLAVGPVALDSLLVAAGVSAIAQSGTESYITAAVTLALMVGAIQLAMGLLKLGFLVNFLSRPVISGFTSAAAILIALSQAKYLLGVEWPNSAEFIFLVSQLVRHADEVQWGTLVMGVSSVALLLALKRWAPKIPAPLLVLTLGALLAIPLASYFPIKVVGAVPGGLPVPRISGVNAELLVALLPTALTIAVVAFTESISVASEYARRGHYEIRADRELVALGCANLAGGLFQGYSVAGSFSRTTVNAQAGAATQLAGLFASVFVLASLLFLAPLLAYLPLVCLAAIILVAVASLVDVSQVRRLHQVKRADLVLLILTFFATLLLGIVQGIVMGVLASLIWLVGKTTRPHIAVLGRIPGTTRFRNVERHPGLITYEGVIALRMDSQFYFGNVAFLKQRLHELETAEAHPVSAVILDASAINNLDSSAESAWAEMADEYASRRVIFCLAGLKGPVADVLENSGLAAKLERRAGFPTVHDALEFVFRRLPMRPIQHTSRGARPARSGREASGASAHL